jgi:hypothetical protein
VAAEKGNGDEDYHIQISNSRTDGGRCVIIEAPNPAFIKNATLSKQSAAVRLFIRDKLLHDKTKEPSSSGNVMVGEVFVEATGQLFFDASHSSLSDPSGGRGKKGMKAGTIWELHPLTSLRFAPKP